jgi:hypothetical protein
LGAKQGMLANTPGSELVSEKELTLGDNLGREFVLKVRGQGQMIVHVYAVKDRFFMLFAGGDGFTPASADVQRFLKSFRPQ